MKLAKGRQAVVMLMNLAVVKCPNRARPVEFFSDSIKPEPLDPLRIWSRFLSDD